MVRDSSEVRPLRDGNGVGRPGFCCAAKGVFDLGIGHDRFLDLTGRTSLHELCEVIAASDVAVTFDSGVLHVANCTEPPIVALFSDPARPSFARRGTGHGASASRGATAGCAACRPWNKCSTRQRPFSATRRSRDAAWPTKKAPVAGAVLEICCAGYFSAFLRFISKLNEEKSPTLPESSTPKT